MERDAVIIPIARTGTFRDSRGRSHTFRAADLDAIAANYDPSREEAPLVLGHPKDNHPAYGWVRRLHTAGNRLLATISHIPDELKNIVRKGHYRHVSMSLHPGGDRLRHVGLLGAVPPAIPGLGPVEMHGDTDSAVTVDFNAADFGETQKMDETQKQLGALEEQVRSLMDQLAAAVARADAAETKLKDLETAKEAAVKDAEETRAEFAAFRGEQEKAARTIRMERLVQAGKVTPGDSADLLAQAEALATIKEPMEFSSGETMTPEERLWKTLEGRSVSPLVGTMTPPSADFSAAPDVAPAVDLSGKI